MTPLIDVVFQLIAFFVFALNFDALHLSWQVHPPAWRRRPSRGSGRSPDHRDHRRRRTSSRRRRPAPGVRGTAGRHSPASGGTAGPGRRPAGRPPDSVRCHPPDRGRVAGHGTPAVRPAIERGRRRMNRASRRRKLESPDLNLDSLVDAVFLLLSFFLLSMHVRTSETRLAVAASARTLAAGRAATPRTSGGCGSRSAPRAGRTGRHRGRGRPAPRARRTPGTPCDTRRTIGGRRPASGGRPAGRAAVVRTRDRGTRTADAAGLARRTGGRRPAVAGRLWHGLVLPAV